VDAIIAWNNLSDQESLNGQNFPVNLRIFHGLIKRLKFPISGISEYDRMSRTLWFNNFKYSLVWKTLSFGQALPELSETRP
jgi:hypothetical protein